MPAHVATVVLAHNGLQDTLECLRSISQLRWESLSVILVDNASTDGTADAVARQWPDVEVLRQSRNLGFAEGNNIGMRHALAAGADYVLLLNNDTTIASDAIARCVEVAEQHRDAAAVCPLIYFAHAPALIWYAGAEFDPRRARSGRMLGYREQDLGQFAGGGETDRATGAAVLLRRAALERVGLLDGKLFFLYEDVDWSLRARQAGDRIYFAPAAKVWHSVSAAAGGEHSALIAYYDTRNHIVICRRHASLPPLRALARDTQILLIHLAGARRAQRRLPYLRAVLHGWRDARRGHLGPRS